MMSNTAIFILHIRNIVKKVRDKMGWVLRVFQSRKRSLTLTLLKSLCHSPTIVLLSALETMECKRHTRYRRYSTNIYIQNHWSTALKLLGKAARTQIILSPQRGRERYIIIYILKITQHMVPNIDGTMGHNIKTRKHPRHGTQCVIQYPTNRNPAQSLQQNAITIF